MVLILFYIYYFFQSVFFYVWRNSSFCCDLGCINTSQRKSIFFLQHNFGSYTLIFSFSREKIQHGSFEIFFHYDRCIIYNTNIYRTVLLILFLIQLTRISSNSGFNIFTGFAIFIGLMKIYCYINQFFISSLKCWFRFHVSYICCFLSFIDWKIYFEAVFLLRFALRLLFYQFSLLTVFVYFPNVHFVVFDFIRLTFSITVVGNWWLLLTVCHGMNRFQIVTQNNVVFTNDIGLITFSILYR